MSYLSNIGTQHLFLQMNYGDSLLISFGRRQLS